MVGVVVVLYLFTNNIRVSNISLVDQDLTNDYIHVQFDLAWDNSWRYAEEPGNWDAAWVVIKFRTGAEWRHATLASSGHTGPSGCEIITPTDRVGVFIQRSEAGEGNVSWSGIRIRWNYGEDGVADNAEIAIRVFAIEMVYIPGGPFYVGGSSTVWDNEFYTYSSGGAPYYITSENEICLTTSSGCLWAEGDIESGTIPGAFPKGYQAFYCMKYEISQAQYRDFLNTITSSQASNRYMGGFGSYRQNIRLTTGTPSYGCDADNDGILNENNDGEWVACNGLGWADLLAYLDFIGLRPMTELEFEKACRGNQGVVYGEYAWGNTTLNFVSTSALTNTNTPEETYSSTVIGPCMGGEGSSGGPARCGVFAGSNTNRLTSGASYWGVMELSGNVYELTVSAGDSEGRGYTGNHGDGTLAANGDHNVEGWPGTSGAKIRGGSWYVTDGGDFKVSDRDFLSGAGVGRDAENGGRGVRTAP